MSQDAPALPHNVNAKSVLGLIPARSGSKGIPQKNIIPLGGRPLLGWVCSAAANTPSLDEVVLSSDSREIIDVAREFGVDAPFMRPGSLARDDTLIVDVLAHALDWFAQHKQREFDYVCLLQPTAPLATSDDYQAAIEKAIDNDADTVISVYRCSQKHPAIMYTLDENGAADWFVKNLGWSRMARRQDLPPVYMRSGIVYVFRASMILERQQLYGSRIYAIEIPEERGAVDIDTPIDVKLAEIMLQELGYLNS